MTYRTKRLLSLLLLVVGLPLYVVAATTLVSWIGRPGIALEFAIYAALGFLWALPFRSVFRGIGREDPDRGRDK